TRPAVVSVSVYAVAIASRCQCVYRELSAATQSRLPAVTDDSRHQGQLSPRWTVGVGRSPGGGPVADQPEDHSKRAKDHERPRADAQKVVRSRRESRRWRSTTDADASSFQLQPLHG